jgi:hypothetical protein
VDLPRTRDVIVFTKDLSFPVMVEEVMTRGGWPGGQGVAWASSASDNFLVTYSDGTYGGFLLWGSDESADQYIAQTRNQPTYNFGVACFGTWVISTAAYERYTLESRRAPPLVANSYSVGQRLRFSLRGLLTPQDEWSIAGDSRAPNDFLVATVIQAPSGQNNQHLMVQTAL